jgi:hypothetical protein
METKGDGKGDVAAQMQLELKDWRNPDSLAKMTDGELYNIITNGRGKMTGGERDRSKETTRWNFVDLFLLKQAGAVVLHFYSGALRSTAGFCFGASLYGGTPD